MTRPEHFEPGDLLVFIKNGLIVESTLILENTLHSPLSGEPKRHQVKCLLLDTFRVSFFSYLTSVDSYMQNWNEYVVTKAYLYRGGEIY